MRSSYAEWATALHQRESQYRLPDVDGLVNKGAIQRAQPRNVPVNPGHPPGIQTRLASSALRLRSLRVLHRW